MKKPPLSIVPFNRSDIGWNNPFGRLAALGSLFLLAGCGFLDAYKPQEKRCKAFCDSDNSETSKPEPFNFALTYWNQTTPRSTLDTDTELVPILRSNPFRLIANALKTVSDDVAEAQRVIPTTPATTQSACLKNVFEAAFNKSDGRTEGAIDYGRCVDLAKLEERLNSNRNIGKDGKMRVIQLDSALQLIVAGQLPLNSGNDALQGANNGLELTQVFPLRTVRASEAARPDEANQIRLHMVRGSVQGTALEKAGASTILKKSWGLLYAGLDEQQPLQVEWTPRDKTVKLSGSLATLSAAFQRTTTQSQWDGFGYSREFIFAGFTLSGALEELNQQLGWSDQVIMNGSYFLRVNGDLIDAGGAQSKLFHMRGINKACMLEVGVVSGFQDGTPVEQSIGQISICNAQN